MEYEKIIPSDIDDQSTGKDRESYQKLVGHFLRWLPARLGGPMIKQIKCQRLIGHLESYL